METKDYLRILREEIHSTVIATVDGEGHPVTRVIDIMLTDENSLYFITAKGKAFYAQLMENPYVAISGMCGGEGTMNKKAISVREADLPGCVRAGRQRGGSSWSDGAKWREDPEKCVGAAGRIFHHGPMPRMPHLLQQMSPEMYRYVCKTLCHSAGTLPVLRKLHGGMSVWSGGEKIREYFLVPQIQIPSLLDDTLSPLGFIPAPYFIEAVCLVDVACYYLCRDGEKEDFLISFLPAEIQRKIDQPVPVATFAHLRLQHEKADCAVASSTLATAILPAGTPLHSRIFGQSVSALNLFTNSYTIRST